VLVGGVELGWSELVAELVGGEAGVSEDAVQGSALELLVERHDEEHLAIRVAEARVTASLSDDFPAASFEP
jgi:hypothetical protein